ncbi:MAG: pyridoxal-5'-phosphate-dependent protein subunit beta [Planctomycetes bacterium]|nr:pyridoxal-5'-phosphate-dependent protein subunit beta [Planctomycetota bacterium]
MTFGLEREVVDQDAVKRTVKRCRKRGIVLPTFKELAEPETIPDDVLAKLAKVDPDSAHALNLFRVHWFNDDARAGQVDVPAHVVLPPELTGVDANIAVVFGDRFPMIGAHKVLAAYGCLVPRLVTGTFDPGRHRALWPSTGNYCRGGIAISKLLGCRGVAILPEGMSAERFAWLEQWVEDEKDIIRTPGTESNVKEIYDACNELAQDEQNVVLNQFCEFGNHVIHRKCTGEALLRLTYHLCEVLGPMVPAAFVSSTGSAGTLAAGHALADEFGMSKVAVEALECPTLLYNGYGEHNIQGIGDKHVPFIHDVSATDFVVGVSDRSSDHLLLLFNTDAGRSYLVDRKGVDPEVVDALASCGLSSLANIVAAIKTARYLKLDAHDLVLTVATDGAALYGSELERIAGRDFPDGFDPLHAAETWGRALSGAATDHVLELTTRERDRIFNLGYFTWVEQQGVSLDDFELRRDEMFWYGLTELPDVWDELIHEFNAKVAG